MTEPTNDSPDTSGAGPRPCDAVTVCPLTAIAPGTAQRHDVDGHRLAVVRIEGEVAVIGDRCTHQDVSLAEGEVDCENRTLECWKHGSLFGIDDGVPTCLPATRPTPVYEAGVADGDVWVVLGD